MRRAMPSNEDINAYARRLGIADPNGDAYRRDRATIVEAIWHDEKVAEQQQDQPAPLLDRRPTAQVIAALARELDDHGIVPEAGARILAAATYTHTARHGITTEDTP